MSSSQLSTDERPPETSSSASPGSKKGAIRQAVTSDNGARIASYLAGIVTWIVLAVLFERVPGPDEVVWRLGQEFANNEVFTNFYLTMLRFFSGLALATILGLVLGLVTGLSPMWRAMFNDTLLIALSIPALIWAFLTVMWFGLGGEAAFTATVLAATPFVAVNVSKGVLGVSRDLRDMSSVFGVPMRRRMRDLVIPAVTGYVIAGIRFGVIIGWNAVLLSEWFGASDGVGYRARYWYDAQRFGGFAAWVVLFIAFIVILDRLILERASRKALAWRDGGDEGDDDHLEAGVGAA